MIFIRIKNFIKIVQFLVVTGPNRRGIIIQMTLQGTENLAEHASRFSIFFLHVTSILKIIFENK